GYMMRYNLDLSILGLQAYKQILKSQNLLPGRRILLQDIDQKFEKIEHSSLKDIACLKKALSTPKKIASFAAETGISEEYLTILKREIGSLDQKPVTLECFPGIDASIVASLKNSGIVNSKDYYEKNDSQNDELFCLCDLVRINGVGAVAAKTFYDAGFCSVAEVARADAHDMLAKVSAVNSEKHYYNANLGAGDMQFCISYASLLIKHLG
ncbi:MAG: DUF4332 domain-containing protein, partial [Eubacteriales bacterium]